MTKDLCIVCKVPDVEKLVADPVFVEALPGWEVAKPFVCEQCRGTGIETRLHAHRPGETIETRCRVCFGSGVKP